MVDKEIADRARAERLREIRDELMRRIRPVCPSMPHDVFVELVEGMATVQLKYELNDSARASSSPSLG